MTTQAIHEAEVVDQAKADPVKRNGKKSTAIAKRSDGAGLAERTAPAPRVTIEDMIMKALDMGQPDLIDKFTAIYEKQQADQRKTAFTAAMARAQAKMVPVANNAINTFTSSRYAKLAAINRMAVPLYGAEGLALSFKTGTAERPGDRRTIAVITHEAGYMDDSSFYVDLPLDDQGSGGKTNKTALHATKSTSTYAKNMLVCMIFNISTEDDIDDDGNAGAYQRINETQVKELNSLAEKTKLKGETAKAVLVKLCKFYGLDKIESLPASKYQSAVGEFQRKANRVKKDEGEILPLADRPQIEPVSESGKGIDAETGKKFQKAMAHAWKEYGEDAGKIAFDEFRKRFPNVEELSQIPDTPEAQKIVLSWISDPFHN
jgi:uncharacterized protein (DUF2384 family)